MNKLTNALLLLPVLAVMAAPAAFADEGDWRFTVGAHTVDPKSGNGSLAGGALDVDVGSSWRPTITGEYFFSDALGLEVLADIVEETRLAHRVPSSRGATAGREA